MQPEFLYFFPYYKATHWLIIELFLLQNDATDSD